jgi:hypothetical protein
VLAGARQTARRRCVAFLVVATLIGCLLTAGAEGRGPPTTFRISYFVKVIGVGDDGKVKPVRGAFVQIHPGDGGHTDLGGRIVVKAAASVIVGDYVEIEASADGFREEHVRLFVDKDMYLNAQARQTAPGRLIQWLLGHHQPVITVTLQPEEDAGPTVQLVVQVKDEDLKPLAGAVVALYRTSPPIGPVSGFSYTTKDGESTFFIPRELIETGLQARVSAGSRGSKFSDVSTSVLRGKGRRIFLVILSGKTGSFALVPSLTEVKNPNAPELKIAAGGGTAVWDHTGPYGGAGKGGEWKVTYAFNVPGALTPGKSSSVTAGMTVSDVQPEQPILFQMGVRAPDFAQALNINYPNPASISKTFTIPISASYKTAKELFIVVGVVSAEVIYHYRRSG